MILDTCELRQVQYKSILRLKMTRTIQFTLIDCYFSISLFFSYSRAMATHAIRWQGNNATVAIIRKVIQRALRIATQRISVGCFSAPSARNRMLAIQLMAISVTNKLRLNRKCASMPKQSTSVKNRSRWKMAKRSSLLSSRGLWTLTFV